MRILVVDDSEDARDIMAVTLSSGGYEDLTFATSGQEGLDRLAQGGSGSDGAFDLVLLDVMMPGMDGPETLRRLREDARTAEVPVVFMTARTQSADVERFLGLGALGVIPKPFDPMALAGEARSYLDR